jgi:hypothetical protein
MKKAFVYKWTHIPTYRWYVGYHVGSEQNYICSSKLIKHHIISSPDEWVRVIVAQGDPEEMYELETEILQLTDAKKDIRSFNYHNNDGRFTTLNRTKEFMSLLEIANRKLANKGKPKSEEHKRKLSDALKGRPNLFMSATIGKGTPKPKNVCRITDKKEMNLSHFVQWSKRLDKLNSTC